MAERQVLENAIFIALMNRLGATQAATALGVLCLEKMAFTGAGAQDLAARSNFKPFGYGFLCLNTFWTSHSVLLKRARNIGWWFGRIKWFFGDIFAGKTGGSEAMRLL